jgi:Putative flagellar system-associated repeat/Secretion system C-terminal sorting domain/Right handed beta helix region
MPRLKLKLLILIYFSLSVSLSGTTYYVSSSGKDSNPGTISQPFFTLNKAWTLVSAGDIVYMRGGTYNYGTTGTTFSGKSGSSGNYINIWAYPNEKPVIDYSGHTFTSWTRGINVANASYIYVKGIRITGISQPLADIAQDGIFLNNNVTNCIFEQIETDHIGGWGLRVYDNVSNILFLNCDSHHNADPHSGDYGGGANYGGSDGFECGSATSTNITFKGCRFWSNSDDGVDLRMADGLFTFENCWSFWNGYIPDSNWQTGGNGEGIKLAGSSGSNTSQTRRFLKNCLVFENRLAGIEDSPDNGYVGHEVYNTIVYNNGYQGMNFEYNSPAILKNNISYMNGSAHNDIMDWQDGPRVTHDHNSFDLSVTVSDADFVSVSSIGTDGPRQADGSLPDVNFLKLVKGSDLIDAGTDVGLIYDGKAPDLGAFEFQSGSPVPSPLYISSVVENVTPSLMVMTYDLNLNNSIVPATSSFSVLVNTLSRKVNLVTLSGNKVQLILESPIKFGDNIKISYTKPSNNQLQTISGGQAASISDKLVINNCQEINKNNDPPIVVVKNKADSYSGFVYEIDASGSSDLNNDLLTYNWTIPNNVSVSSTSSSKIQFLAPVVNTAQTIKFQLNVTDGIAVVSKSIPINILPYKPELAQAIIKNSEASVYQAPDSPNNVSDGSLSTKWCADGDNQWLSLSLAGPFKISHLLIAFLPGQSYSSYFDIYASGDKIAWEPILINETSCNFSGHFQVFDLPALNLNKDYSYIKYVGHGNSLNTFNDISEFKVFGNPKINPGSGNTNKNVIIFPNPAKSYVNISILEPAIKPDKVRLIDVSGKVVLEVKLNPDNKNVKIPLSINSGLYIVELEGGNLVLFSQNLVVLN